MKWQSAKSHATASAMAAEIGGDADALADVVPTMRLMFEKARAGTLNKSGDILNNASFAFGTWCSIFTMLREELHPAKGVANGFPRSSYPEVRR